MAKTPKTLTRHSTKTRAPTEKGSRGRRGGRPRIYIKEEDRAKVRLWVAGGIPEEIIAELLKISRATLLRRFPKEIKNGAAIERATNMARLVKAADGGNVAAIKFLEQRFAVVASHRQLQEGDATDRTDKHETVEPAPVPVEPELGKREQILADAQRALEDKTGEWGDDLLPPTVVAFPTKVGRG